MANDVNSDLGTWIASRRRLFLVGLVISLLALSVGTRTFRLKISNSATVESDPARAMGQHLDQDAQAWVAPVLPVAILRLYASHIPVAHPDGFPRVLLQQRPFDRPPPFLLSFCSGSVGFLGAILSAGWMPRDGVTLEREVAKWIRRRLK